MNSIERITAALNHQEADRVPAYPILAGVTRKLVGASYEKWSTDAETCANAYIKAVRKYDLDCVVSLIDLSIECTAWGQELIFSEQDAAHPNYKNCVIKEIEDYEKIRKVDYRTCERMMMHIDVCKRLAAEFKGEKPVIAFVFGPLGTLSMLRNQSAMYMDLYDDPDAVKGAAREIAATLKEYAEALCDVGVNAIMWDTLFASGSIMSKQMWVEMESDLMRELSAAVRAKGCLNMIHNCGEKIYFDVQIDAIQPAAISFLYPPDDCEDFADCKAKYGDKVTLIGCVPPTNVVLGTDEEWDQICRDQIDAMAKGGGFILATGCEFPSGSPLDRAKRMVDVAKTYGVYHK